MLAPQPKLPLSPPALTPPVVVESPEPPPEAAHGNAKLKYTGLAIGATGLIVTSLGLYYGVQAQKIWVELSHLIQAALGDTHALDVLVTSIGYKATAILGPDGTSVVGYTPIKALNETIIMLVVLGLIDVVMISNLLIMVIVGGYETFVSRMYLEGHPDQPEWLSHVNASVLKVKLATAIIGISSIHLLKTFISADNYSEKVLLWQTVIHLAFLLSAMAIAFTDRLLVKPSDAH